MPNSYGTYTYDERYSAQQTWTQTRANKALQKSDYLAEALSKIIDPDYPEEGFRLSIADPLHVEVSSGVVWTCGWWQSADGRWWWLWKVGDVASFTRGEADFYIPTGGIDDVPSS